MDRIKQTIEILKNENRLRIIPSINTKKDGKIIIDGREYINFASNDYLGISTKKTLVEEFLAQNKSLMSSASARLMSGTSEEFTVLENTLKSLFKKEACLIFNTGYQCNLGIVSSLCEKGDVIFSDKLNHASIIDGMKLANGDFIRYKHLDYDNLEKLLSTKRENYKRAIIVSESVFSMDGDIANIDKLIELKKKYNCLLMIDEAHAFCACGNDLTGITGNKEVDIITATFGKAVGSFGAFCVANNDIILYLINKARSFIFSTSIPPVNIAWTNWLLTEKRDYLRVQKTKLEQILKDIEPFLSNNTQACSQIVPIVIGSNKETIRIAEKLKAEGYYIPAIRPPTVPNGTSRLRLSLTADTNPDDIKNVFKIVHEFLF